MMNFLTAKIYKGMLNDISTEDRSIVIGFLIMFYMVMMCIGLVIDIIVFPFNIIGWVITSNRKDGNNE